MSEPGGPPATRGRCGHGLGREQLGSARGGRPPAPRGRVPPLSPRRPMTGPAARAPASGWPCHRRRDRGPRHSGSASPVDPVVRSPRVSAGRGTRPATPPPVPGPPLRPAMRRTARRNLRHARKSADQPVRITCRGGRNRSEAPRDQREADHRGTHSTASPPGSGMIYPNAIFGEEVGDRAGVPIGSGPKTLTRSRRELLSSVHEKRWVRRHPSVVGRYVRGRAWVARA